MKDRLTMTSAELIQSHGCILNVISLFHQDKSIDEKETECGPPDCKVFKQDEDSSVNSKHVKASSNGICIACLGVLQESFIEKIIDEVRL